MKTVKTSLQTFSGVFFLNALLAFPVLYLVYKHYSAAVSPMDIDTFMETGRRGNGFLEPPFRFRYVTGFLARMIGHFPGYNISIAFSSDPGTKREFFHFIVLNFLATVTASSLLFLYLREKLRPAFAYLGSVLYLFSFFSVLVNLVPMSDASCQLAIIACVLAMEKKQPLWFALAFLAGIFSKETILFVLPPWILLSAFSDRRRLRYLLYALPAFAIYFTVSRLNSIPSSQPYYAPDFLMQHVLSAFNPGHYDRSLFFHVFLSQLPLFACLALFLYLKFIRKAQDLKFNTELLLVPFLIWVGVTTDISNNTGRLVFLAFPAILYFEAMVLQKFVTESI